MNIRTQTSRPIGFARIQRETQDYAVFSVYRTALADHFARTGSLTWHIQDLLQSETGADRREETLYLPAAERAEMLAIMRKHLTELAE